MGMQCLSFAVGTALTMIMQTLLNKNIPSCSRLMKLEVLNKKFWSHKKLTAYIKTFILLPSFFYSTGTLLTSSNVAYVCLLMYSQLGLHCSSRFFKMFHVFFDDGNSRPLILVIFTAVGTP